MKTQMTPSDIEGLLEAWRSAERALDGHPLDTDEQAKLADAVRIARDAYLAAVRERAAAHDYAGGTRDLHADIEHLREAEDRRAAAGPSTPPYRQAARDVQDRALRIVAQVTEDEARADQESRRREAGQPD